MFLGKSNSQVFGGKVIIGKVHVFLEFTRSMGTCSKKEGRGWISSWLSFDPMSLNLSKGKWKDCKGNNIKGGGCSSGCLSRSEKFELNTTEKNPCEAGDQTHERAVSRFNCSQTKFVAIILVLLDFFMQFFAWTIFRLKFLTFCPQKLDKQVAPSGH